MKKKRKKTGSVNSNIIRFPRGETSKIAVSSRDKEEYRVSFWTRHRSLLVISCITLILCAVLTGAYLYIAANYTIATTYVEGNVHYTSEEIREIVMEGYLGNNSIFLSLKYKDKSIEGIPFIEKMDVAVLAPDTVKISVYEKALAGCIEYLGRYMYFDKDGIVVESSLELTKGVPQVTGLYFDYIILYEKLPVEDVNIFNRIMSITQIVNKNEISVDKIYFGAGNEITLYFDDVKAALGTGEELEEKVMALQFMLPELEGKKGTLRLENYTETTKDITFQPDA